MSNENENLPGQNLSKEPTNREEDFDSTYKSVVHSTESSHSSAEKLMDNRKNSKPSGFKIFIPVIAILLFFTGYYINSVNYKDGSSSSESYIGVVEISGVILESTKINYQLLDLKNDPQVKGIIVRINSPGGSVASSQEIYDMLRDISEVKKVYVSMGDVAASGGYYIAMGANKIYANPGTVTGSIGVIVQTYNVEKLMEKVGVKAVIYKSGKNKDILSMFRPVTEEELDIIQGMVNNTYSQFVQAVATGRGMLTEEVEEIADGRIFNGQQAMDAGLIDGLHSFYGVFNEMKKELEIPDAVLLDPRESFDKMLEYLQRWANTGFLGKSVLNKLNPGLFFIMPGWYI